MLILGVCGVIRSLSRVLLGFVLGVGFDVGVLYEYSVLGDILFICVEFIRGLSEVGWLGRVGERWCGDGVFCCGCWGEFEYGFG